MIEGDETSDVHTINIHLFQELCVSDSIEMIKIIIVDDHVLFREGLAGIIRQEADIEVVGLVGTVQEAVEICSDS